MKLLAPPTPSEIQINESGLQLQALVIIKGPRVSLLLSQG